MVARHILLDGRPPLLLELRLRYNEPEFDLGKLREFRKDWMELFPECFVLGLEDALCYRDTSLRPSSYLEVNSSCGFGGVRQHMKETVPGVSS